MKVEIVHKDLSYQIMGVLFRVYNELGGGYQERVYQAAVGRELMRSRLGFVEQQESAIVYAGQRLGKYRLDFIIEQKVVLELKVAPKFAPRDIMQVLGYLKNNGLELGILASFSRGGLFTKRILRGHVSSNYRE